jgi:Flp pilus assembly protein CpaB
MRRWLTIGLAVALVLSGMGNLALGVMLLAAREDAEQSRRAAAADRVSVVVAAANLQTNQEITAGDIKTVETNRERERAWRFSGKMLLLGSQPVGRITRTPIRAEEPIFEEDLLPFGINESTGRKVQPGMRALVVEVSSKHAILDQGDYVDVLCTLKEPPRTAPGGPSRTAVMAHGLKVIGPPNIIRSGAQPSPEPRAYTLEAGPYRNALVELARQRGGTFTLSVCGSPVLDGQLIVPQDKDDPNTDLVTEADLAKLFSPKGKAATPLDDKP